VGLTKGIAYGKVTMRIATDTASSGVIRAKVKCKKREQVVGGGYGASGALKNLLLTASQPLWETGLVNATAWDAKKAGNGWRAEGLVLSTQPKSTVGITAWALCMAMT
jgi:hypothetical protein